MAEEHDPSEPIITFTGAAREKLLEVIDAQELRGRGAVRLEIQGRGPGGFEYAMSLEEHGQAEPSDTVLDEGDFKVFVDAETIPRLQGARVDYVDQLMGGGFRIDNPNPVWTDPTALAIQQLIDDSINPAVGRHGGHVDLLDVKDNTVYVRLGGGCQGCGMVDVTLRQGIEALIKEQFPDIVQVVDATDHAGGTNPYYQPAKGGASPYYQSAKG
jgi:Fe/S biogenesis protein NfuA